MEVVVDRPVWSGSLDIPVPSPSYVVIDMLLGLNYWGLPASEVLDAIGCPLPPVSDYFDGALR